MTDRGCDIDFDFFEEPETQEATTRSPTRAPRRPIRPPGGLTPLLRLVGLIAFAILAVVLLVFWVQSCRAESKQDAYRTYMQNVRAVGRDSARLGTELNTLLTTRGIKQAELAEQLGGLAQRQEQDVARAREIEAPAPLREEHEHAIEALELRASGLSRLNDAFARTARARNARGSSELLALQTQRLLASDVIWDDLFRTPALAELRRQNLGGAVDVPDSNFLGDANLATARGMDPILQRIRGAATGGTPRGRHGNGLVSVRVLPGGQELERDADNTVTATADLAFEVVIENSGEAQEVQVPVRLTIQQRPNPIVKRETVDLINPGERKTVVFRNLGQIVQFVQKTTVRVEVSRVPGERNLANNSAEYFVTFTLTPS